MTSVRVIIIIILYKTSGPEGDFNDEELIPVTAVVH